MPPSAGTVTSRRVVSVVLAGMTVLATVQAASADDGIGGFLQSIFGGGNQQVAAPAPAPVYQRSEVPMSGYRRSYVRFRPLRPRPLTVRLHRAAPKLVVAQMPTKPGKVSIYEDRTLKRGDAVMTADGIRVFAGSASWPYTKADFVALSAAKDLNKDTVKVLAEVNSLPRS